MKHQDVHDATPCATCSHLSEDHSDDYVLVGNTCALPCKLCGCKTYQPSAVTEIYLVVCADGQPCGKPDSAGGTWEDLHANPYYARHYAEFVVEDLDSTQNHPNFGPEYKADCGPHKIIRFVKGES